MNAVGAVAALPDAPMLLLAGCLLLLSMWLLALLRGEHIPSRTLVEGVLLTLGACAAALARHALHPIVFVAALYAVLMRVRLCVDAGNLLAARGLARAARRFYALALRLGPAESDRVLVLLNEGILFLREGRCAEALERLVQAAGRRQVLGTRQQAGCLFNLGVCYEKLGRADDALRTYEEAADTHPTSEFARRARKAAERERAVRRSGSGSGGTRE